MQKRIISSGFLFFILGFLIHCGEPKGNFGWATSLDEGTSILDKEFHVQTEYQMMREDLLFSPNETIHFVYSFDSSVSPKDEFFFSLNRKSIDYLEIDLRKKSIEEGGAVIRDSYTGLEVGDYLLKVAFEGDVFDQVEFKVLPEDGYFTENLERELTGEIEDEIIRYSR
jgi:hypothetical protein